LDEKLLVLQYRTSSADAYFISVKKL